MNQIPWFLVCLFVCYLFVWAGLSYGSCSADVDLLFPPTHKLTKDSHNTGNSQLYPLLFSYAILKWNLGIPHSKVHHESTSWALSATWAKEKHLLRMTFTHFITITALGPTKLKWIDSLEKCIVKLLVVDVNLPHFRPNLESRYKISKTTWRVQGTITNLQGVPGQCSDKISCLPPMEPVLWLGITCGLSFLFLYLPPWGFSPGTSVLSSRQQPKSFIRSH